VGEPNQRICKHFTSQNIRDRNRNDDYNTIRNTAINNNDDGNQPEQH